jgi:hypothetical protein
MSEFTIGQARAILRLVDFARLARESRYPVKCGIAPQAIDEAERAALYIRELCGPQLAEGEVETVTDTWRCASCGGTDIRFHTRDGKQFVYGTILVDAALSPADAEHVLALATADAIDAVRAELAKQRVPKVVPHAATEAPD